MDIGRHSAGQPHGRSAARVLLAVARIGLAHEFFGHVFEVVTKVPDRYAIEQRPGDPDERMPSLLSSGSPLRYFAPVAPVTVAATLGALIASRREGRARGWLAACAVGLLSSEALTAYIVRALNVPLFVAGQPLAHGERRALLRTWYRLTAARIALCGGASVMATIAHCQLRSSPAGGTTVSSSV